MSNLLEESAFNRGKRRITSLSTLRHGQTKELAHRDGESKDFLFFGPDGMTEFACVSGQLVIGQKLLFDFTMELSNIPGHKFIRLVTSGRYHKAKVQACVVGNLVAPLFGSWGLITYGVERDVGHNKITRARQD